MHPSIHVVMTMSRHQLANLFRDAGAAHHRAFADTDGADPDWARWYAEYLASRLPDDLRRSYSLDALAAELERLDQQYRRAATDQPWADYYAEHLAGGGASSSAGA